MSEGPGRRRIRRDLPRTADVVIVGAGTVGGWAAYFARTSGAERVVVLERNVAGGGASGMASGIVRAQGGTVATVGLGRWSQAFYRRQSEMLGVDSGFQPVGYLILAVRHRDVELARSRMQMQREAGVDVRWLDPAEVAARWPILSPKGHRGGTFAHEDGYIDAALNVRAYLHAMWRTGVELVERTPLVGVRLSGGSRSDPRVTGVITSQGTIATSRVILAAGPWLRAVGKALGLSVPVGRVRHQVAVTEPHPALARPFPMAIDVGAGLYWRPAEGGALLFGMSNPYEVAGDAREVDWGYLRRMRRRLARSIPISTELGLRAVWAGTTEFTPDHLPIVGPAVRPDGRALQGVVLASAGGHGMMWGPAVSRIAVDLALEGRSALAEAADLGLERFDEEGRSRFTNPLALPFPRSFGDEEGEGNSRSG